MYTYRKIFVAPELPQNISRIRELAYNLWWSWNPRSLRLFSMIDEELWEKCRGNPVLFLQNVSQKCLVRASNDARYLEEYTSVFSEYDRYMSKEDSWFSSTYPEHSSQTIAYLSAEYGFSETLPIYSGGLGILSGDHCKTASDMGLPFVAAGLLYQEGYFNQIINRDGWPESHTQPLDFNELPILPVYDANGDPFTIQVDFPGRKVHARIWRVNVGKVHLYLLDTNISPNADYDRNLLRNLYGGDQETRISQEILLGMGGIKALKALGYQPSIVHMNEGHCAFAVFELIKDYMTEQGLSFDEALEAVSSSTLFTTHTPVPAGTDTFSLHMMDRYFEEFYSRLGISRQQFLGLGLAKNWEGQDIFNMTVLGLKAAGLKNGVSALHGMVSRNIFHLIWPALPEEEVPISHITNGIHLETWAAPELLDLLQAASGQDWGAGRLPADIARRIDEISPTELWTIHRRLKEKLLCITRDRMIRQRIRQGKSIDWLKDSATWNPNALIIGFARRFATYKRATLIFRDRERLLRILNQPDRPVRIIFAGKAHPADYQGQELVKQIQDIMEQPEFRGKILFIENYDMQAARHLVQGVDVWLNNPKKPLEASGTSGQKAGLNGCINFSILDGWWLEGYNEKNGWSIGDESYCENPDNQDDMDSMNLYDTLEEKIIPEFFQRNAAGIPEAWVRRMKESIKTILLEFSTRRMLEDYTHQMYIPLLKRMKSIMEDGFHTPRELAKIKSTLHKYWKEVDIQPVVQETPDRFHIGEPLHLQCRIKNGSIPEELLQPEVFFGKIGRDGMLEDPEAIPMKRMGDSDIYEAYVTFEEGGQYGYTFRLRPHHEGFIDPLETGLVKWANLH